VNPLALNPDGGRAAFAQKLRLCAGKLAPDTAPALVVEFRSLKG